MVYLSLTRVCTHEYSTLYVYILILVEAVNKKINNLFNARIVRMYIYVCINKKIQNFFLKPILVVLTNEINNFVINADTYCIYSPSSQVH